MRITDTETLPDNCACAAPGKHGFYKRQGLLPRPAEAPATELPYSDTPGLHDSLLHI